LGRKDTIRSTSERGRFFANKRRKRISHNNKNISNRIEKEKARKFKGGELLLRSK